MARREAGSESGGRTGRRRAASFCGSGMIRLVGRDRPRGSESCPASIKPDRAEVGVLDGPPVALDGGDRHAQRGRVALPRHDDRRRRALRRVAYCSIARGNDAGRADGRELHDGNCYLQLLPFRLQLLPCNFDCLCYSGPVVEPVRTA